MNATPQKIAHFRIVRELGRGAMGVVYHAVDETLDREVALKVIRVGSISHDIGVEGMRARFRREARLAARLNHPTVVTIYSFTQADDLDLIAMELLDGETMEAQIAAGRRWTPLEAARAMEEIARGVGAAHAAGVIHRDLKPGNLMLLRTGSPKILDFGIAKPAVAEGTLALTTTNQVIGTVPYMSPEQLSGHELGPQTDVFSLGAILYEMVTGERAFGTGTFPSIAVRVMSEEPPALSEPTLARSTFGLLQPVLQRALEKAPEERFADAEAMAEALAELAKRRRVSPVPAPRRGPAGPAIGDDAATITGPMPAARPAGRRLRRTGIAAAAAVLLVAVAGVAQLARNGIGAGDVPADTTGTEPFSAGAREPVPAGPLDDGIEEPGRAVSLEDIEESPVDTTTSGSQVAPLADTVAASPPPEPRILAGTVRALPAGAAIREVGGEARSWTDVATVEVASGSSVQLRIEKDGYESRRVSFEGRDLTVRLTPTPVRVSFTSPVPSQVLIADRAGAAPRELGSTAFASEDPASSASLTRSLTPGEYRVVFRRGEGAETEIAASVAVGAAQQQIRDPAHDQEGHLNLTISPTWGYLSVDGAPEVEVDRRVLGLAPGRHVLRIRRDGFATAVDTVLIAPAQELIRSYSLTRN